jgi:hypothetical protein
VSHEPVPDGHTTPDQHIRHAELLANRIRLAAHQPAEAIVAAGAAVAAAPDDLDALVTRGMGAVASLATIVDRRPR